MNLIIKLMLNEKRQGKERQLDDFPGKVFNEALQACNFRYAYDFVFKKP